MRAAMKRAGKGMAGRLAAAAIIGVVAASLGQAQTTPPPEAPDGKLETGVVTPERVTQQIEEWAKQRQESGGPSARVAHVWIFSPAVRMNSQRLADTPCCCSRS
jgi:hypothetical protein